MRSLFSIFLLFFPILAFSQKTINVVGTSEMLVEPKEFKFSITLKEFEDGKDSKSIKDLEKELLKSLEKNDVPAENIRMSSFQGNSYRVVKKKDPGFRASKTYQLTVGDPGKLETIFEPLDPLGVENVYLIEATRDDMEDLKRKNRINALAASKEKASYLLESIGKQPGEVIKISESPIQENMPSNRIVYESALMDVADAVTVGSQPIEFRKIKIVNRIYAVYEIKDKP